MLIGFIGAEVTQHGGIAILRADGALATARAATSQMVSEVGDFLLVYAPLRWASARHATARPGHRGPRRAGERLGGMWGACEEPRNADLVLDASAMTRQEAVDAVLKLLTKAAGWPAPPTRRRNRAAARRSSVRIHAQARPVRPGGPAPVDSRSLGSSVLVLSPRLRLSPGVRRGRLPRAWC